jgi:type VI secretion system protein ImpH
LSDYKRFFPGGLSLRRLSDWIRNYVGYEFDWDIKLTLKQDDVPRLGLGGDSRLGLTSWLGDRPAGDAADMLLQGGGYGSDK